MYMSTMLASVGSQMNNNQFASFSSHRKQAQTNTCLVNQLMFHPYVRSGAPLQSTQRMIAFFNEAQCPLKLTLKTT